MPLIHHVLALFRGLSPDSASVRPSLGTWNASPSMDHLLRPDPIATALWEAYRRDESDGPLDVQAVPPGFNAPLLNVLVAWLPPRRTPIGAANDAGRWPVPGEPWADLEDATPAERLMARVMWQGASPWRVPKQAEDAYGIHADAPAAPLFLLAGYPRLAEAALRCADAPSVQGLGTLPTTVGGFSDLDWVEASLTKGYTDLALGLIERGHAVDGALLRAQTPEQVARLLAAAPVAPTPQQAQAIVKVWLKGANAHQARQLIQALAEHPDVQVNPVALLREAVAAGKPSPFLARLKAVPLWRDERTVHAGGAQTTLAFDGAMRSFLRVKPGELRIAHRLVSTVNADPELAPGVHESLLLRVLLAGAAIRTRKKTQEIEGCLAALGDLAQPWPKGGFGAVLEQVALALPTLNPIPRGNVARAMWQHVHEHNEVWTVERFPALGALARAVAEDEERPGARIPWLPSAISGNRLPKPLIDLLAARAKGKTVWPPASEEGLAWWVVLEAKVKSNANASARWGDLYGAFPALPDRAPWPSAPALAQQCASLARDPKASVLKLDRLFEPWQRVLESSLLHLATPVSGSSRIGPSPRL